MLLICDHTLSDKDLEQWLSSLSGHQNDLEGYKDIGCQDPPMVFDSVGLTWGCGRQGCASLARLWPPTESQSLRPGRLSSFPPASILPHCRSSASSSRFLETPASALASADPTECAQGWGLHPCPPLNGELRTRTASLSPRLRWSWATTQDYFSS